MTPYMPRVLAVTLLASLFSAVSWDGMLSAAAAAAAHAAFLPQPPLYRRNTEVLENRGYFRGDSWGSNHAYNLHPSSSPSDGRQTEHQSYAIWDNDRSGGTQQEDYGLFDPSPGWYPGEQGAPIPHF